MSAPARERLLQAAEERFYREGIHTTGVDRLVETAGVAKMSLYNNFASKDEVVVAYLRHRHAVWQRRLAARLEAAGPGPERILAVFDTYLDYSAEPGYRGCAFLNALAEVPSLEPARQVIAEHKASVAGNLHRLARDAGITDAETVADHLYLLLEGAVATAGIRRDAQPIHTARRIAAEILAAA